MVESKLFAKDELSNFLAKSLVARAKKERERLKIMNGNGAAEQLVTIIFKHFYGIAYKNKIKKKLVDRCRRYIAAFLFYGGPFPPSW